MVLGKNPFVHVTDQGGIGATALADRAIRLYDPFVAATFFIHVAPFKAEEVECPANSQHLFLAAVAIVTVSPFERFVNPRVDGVVVFVGAKFGVDDVVAVS